MIEVTTKSHKRSSIGKCAYSVYSVYSTVSEIHNIPLTL